MTQADHRSFTVDDAKKLVEFCEGRGIKQVCFGNFVVEFFPKEPEAMKLDPVSLSKALTDSLPPDSAMLFASSEDMAESEEKVTQ